MFAKPDSSDMSVGSEPEELSPEDDSSLHGSEHDTSDKSDGKQEILREQEGYQAVRCTKWLVYVILFVCAAVSAAATWFFVRSEEKTEFEDEVSLSVCDGRPLAFVRTANLTVLLLRPSIARLPRALFFRLNAI